MKKTFIERAQEVYESIIDFDKLYTHKFFVQQTLDGYGVEYPDQLNILKNILECQDAPILEFSIFEDGNFQFSFKDTYDFGKKDGLVFDKKSKKYYVDLRKDKRFIEDMASEEVRGQYSILAALVIWEQIRSFLGLKKEAIEKRIDYNKEDLSPLLKRSFGRFCALYTYINSETDFNAYLSAQTLLFFSYLWKSVAVGEFYIVPDFKDIIKPIKEPSPFPIDNSLFPAFAGNYYSDISLAIKTFYNRVDPCRNHFYELHFDSDLDLVNDFISANPQIEQLKYFMRMTQMLFDITVIDIRYFASENNLHKLANFIEGFDRLNKNLVTRPTTITKDSALPNPNIQRISHFLKNMFGFDALTFLKDTIESQIYKACVMWNQIIMQPSPDRFLRLSYNSLTNVYVNSIIKKYCKFSTQYDVDFFYTSFQNQANSEIKGNTPFLVELEKCCQENNRYPNFSCISINNNQIKASIDSYIKASKLYWLIHEDKDQINIVKEIESFVSGCYKSIENLKYASPSLFVKSILWMTDYIKKNDEKDHRKINLYLKLLNCLRLFTILYSNGKITPKRYRSFFEYSFCKVDVSEKKAIKVHIETENLREKYDCNSTSDCFFFASQGYNPVNMLYLENFFVKYNRECRMFESRAIEDSIEVSKESSLQAGEMVKKMGEERSRTLQLVGLLGSFIAFVSSLVGMQKVAQNIYDFMLFALTFMTGVLVFVLCIQLISKSIESPSSSNQDKKWWKHNSINFVLLVLILFISLLACIRSCVTDTTFKNNKMKMLELRLTEKPICSKTEVDTTKKDTLSNEDHTQVKGTLPVNKDTSKK